LLSRTTSPPGSGVGAREGAVRPGVVGAAAAVLHAQELSRALVELVVADRVDVEAELVHRLDRRLVVEERRQQRARPDEVAGGDDDRAPRVARLERLDVRGQVLDPAGRRPVDEAARGLEVAVEVVDPDDLHVDGPAPIVAAAVVPVPRRRRADERAGEDGRERVSQPHVMFLPFFAAPDALPMPAKGCG
jgi:hypothetical protein